MSHTFTFLTFAPQSKAPTITIRKGGMLALNESALQMLGDEVAFVQLGYDETKKAIGLRVAGEGSTGRYRLRKQTKSQTRLVDGKRLFALHGLNVEKARALKAQDFGDGIVGVSLNGEAKEGEPCRDSERRCCMKASIAEFRIPATRDPNRHKSPQPDV